MKNLIIKLFKLTLGLLGIAIVDSCVPQAEYGCPHADFEAKGIVTDEDGKGIQGIRVVISAEHPNPSTLVADTLWTNQNGEYDNRDKYLESRIYKVFTYKDSVKFEFEDVDGQENGGEFQKVSVKVPVLKVKDGDGKWYEGAYKAEADVTMKKK